MGHGKLRKFAENETFACLLQPSSEQLLDKAAGPGLHVSDHPVKGHWCERMFDAPRPIVLELGCGKGDYTIALAERHPELNFIGVDIKGARLWKGAKYATEQGLRNVAFLRTRIEFITAFFAPGEVSEIWLTFSDPQLRGSDNKRLTSPLFLERYRAFLRPGGVIHLKTDSRFLHEYTRAVIAANGLHTLVCNTDIYASSAGKADAGAEEGCSVWRACPPPDRGRGRGPLDTSSCEAGTQETVGGAGASEGCGVPQHGVTSGAEAPAFPAEGAVDAEVTGIQTFYERMFLQMGLPITYLRFTIDHEGPYVAPEDFDAPYWRAEEGPRRTFGHQ